MAEKNKKSRKRKERSASPLSRVLASSSVALTVANRFFDNLSPNQIRSYFHQIANHRHFRAGSFVLTPTEEAFYRSKTPPTTFERNIAWCLAIVEYHSGSIQNAIQADNEITACILRQDFDDALQILDRVDSAAGLSMWSLSLRSAVLTSQGLLEEKRALMTKVNERAGDNRFFKGVLHLKMNRQDEVDISSGDTRYFEQKVRRTFSGDVLHFVMYKLVQNTFEFDLDYARVLAIEKNSSPIDIFLFLQDFLLYGKLYPANGPYEFLVSPIASTLIRQFESATLLAIGNALQISNVWQVHDDELSLLDLYTGGQYEEVCSKLGAMPKLAEKFSMFEIWAKSAARTATYPEGYIGDLLEAAASILRKDTSHDKSAAFLLAQCEALSTLAWYRELHLFVIRETRFINDKVNQAISWTSTAISTVDSPYKSYVLDRSKGSVFAANFTALRECHMVVRLFEAVSQEGFSLSDIPSEVAITRSLKFVAQGLIREGNDDEAVKILQQLSGDPDNLVAHDAARELVSAYIRLGRIEEAVGHYVQAVLHNPGLLRTFDNKSIAGACEGLLGETKKIAVPIALSLYSRFIDEEYDAALRYAFEAFLDQHGVSTPTELIGIDFPVEQLNYFLEHVCVPPVMKLYLYFDSVREIEEARIAVCKLLAERGHNSELMVSEIKERTRQLFIMAGTKHVENSRIYADTGVFSRAESSIPYRQLFEKFSTLRRNDYSESPDEMALNEFTAHFDSDSILAENAHTLHIQDMVLNEKNATFLKLLQLMRDEFTFGERGLSGYLSTRIRHGHLPNTLRKCISDEGLICSRILKTGGYRDDAPWLLSVERSLPNLRQEITKVFIDFSSKIDALVGEVNDVWLQLFTVDQEISGLTSIENSSNHLFNYSVTAVESFYIESQLPVHCDYSELVKVVVEWLWGRTERNLFQIRERVSAEVRERSNSALESLNKSVTQLIGERVETNEFIDSVNRARVALNSATDTVVGWFTRSRGSSLTMFESIVPIEIARLSSGVIEQTHEDTTGLVFDGKALTYFVDVFYVLLDNCVSKSGLGNNVVVFSQIILSANGVMITVQNDCAHIGHVGQANQRLDFYRDHYGKEEYAIKAAQGEGGSGYFKVWKALIKDLELQHAIDFGYISETSFNVEIIIPLDQIAKVLYRENTAG